VKSSTGQRGRSIVCFSSNDWTDLPSSKLHIMRYLGRRDTVLYVETLGVRTPRVSGRDLRRAIQKLRLSMRGLANPESNIFVWSPLAIPFHGSRLSAWVNSRMLSLAIRPLMARLGMTRPIIWSYLPNAVDIIKRLPSSKIIYHCIDDYAAFTDVPAKAFHEAENRMLALADLTVVSSRRLYELREKQARRILYSPHGVNLEEIREGLRTNVPLSDIDAVRHPIAGFVGRIADWIDLELIAACAARMPTWSFVLVGPSNVSLEAYSRLPNVHFLGRKDHRLIPQYIQRFDVCLMPFVSNALVESINPLKLYEYLAVGKPVVSVPMPELERMGNLVRTAVPEEFVEAIKDSYVTNNPSLERQRIAYAGQRSWGAVAEEILTAVEGGGLEA